MTPNELSSLIDHTILGPLVTKEQVKLKVENMFQYKFRSLCVSLNMAQYAKKLLDESCMDNKLCTVINFPHGNSLFDVVKNEAERCINFGVDEVDIVAPLGFVVCQGSIRFQKFLTPIVRLLNKKSIVVKVIIESGLFDKQTIEFCCQQFMEMYCMDKVQVDFIKTSTGFNGPGAQTDDIKCIRDFVDYNIPNVFKIKASGGIKTLQDVKNVLAAGADIIGCSGSINIIEECKNDS